MLAHAFLAIATAVERDHASALAGLIELTVAKFRGLFATLLLVATVAIDSPLDSAASQEAGQELAERALTRLAVVRVAGESEPVSPEREELRVRPRAR